MCSRFSRRPSWPKWSQTLVFSSFTGKEEVEGELSTLPLGTDQGFHQWRTWSLTSTPYLRHFPDGIRYADGDSRAVGIDCSCLGETHLLFRYSSTLRFCLSVLIWFDLILFFPIHGTDETFRYLKSSDFYKLVSRLLLNIYLPVSWGRLDTLFKRE